MGCIEMKKSFEEFRRHRDLFTWFGHTRPDLFVRTGTRQTFGIHIFKEINITVKLEKRNSKHELFYGILNKDTVHLRYILTLHLQLMLIFHPKQALLLFFATVLTDATYLNTNLTTPKGCEICIGS